ncbi:MAG: cytochrome c oxidase subunit 3 [Alphaproteobacteria bacterium]|jgi:cytochrome c oxidase subunit III|nr:cytochrome c oxidase subunit 3 [Alphaproteobacteria bacterium]MBT7943784.1 cytochrome c oxidase subunit 3 [Alphaproteobacteria bacterium]
MASDSVKKHPFHMVNPSPWPVVGTLAALMMAFGGVWFMKGGSSILLATGFVLMLWVFYRWWRDVVIEARNGADHNDVVRAGLRMGMVLFIASEVMFFFAFFWAYFDATIPFLSLTAHTVWPPKGVVPLEAMEVPLLNTIILLSSGATLTVAHHKLRHGNQKATANWLLLTVLLGLTFTGFQAYEYYHATFPFTGGIYSSTFYLATGFHGFHVIVGTCFLLVCFFRARAGHFTDDAHVGFEAAAWYWHFVDVVWLFLFVAIYWWGGSGYTGA